MSNYLRREADSFVFRRRVPSALHQRLGLKEIYRSLKTTVRRTARARAAHLYLATEGLFRMVEEDDDEVLLDEDIQAAITFWLSGPTWSRRLRTHLHELSPGALRNCHQELPNMLLEMGRPEYSRSFDENLIEEAWSALGYSDYEGHARGETLQKAMTVLQRTLKEYVDKRMQEVFEPATVAAIADNAAPSAAAPANMSKISTFISKWQKDITQGYSDGKKLGDETTDQYLQSVELFIGLMGDLPVGKITFDLAADFREKILKLPSSHGKSRTGSIKKELAIARANTDAPRLTMKTAKRHFSGLNSIWKWLIYRKHVPAQFNPFSGHSFPGTKSTKAARDAWSSEDLERLLSSSAYKEAHHDSALRWLPLVSLFSGLRLEEICRLRPDKDLIMRDKVYCFEIKARTGWDPKTEAGSRVVPVHSWLLYQGFKEFVDRQRVAQSEHLFPELRLHKGKLSSGFSRDFSRMKTELGVGRKTTFHSFRHTFRTALGSTDHKDSHIDAVMGHEGGGGEGRVYDKGVTTAKLKEVVESFAPILDIGAIKPTLLTAPVRSVQMGNTPMPKVKKRKLTPPVLDEKGRQIRRSK